MEPATISIYDFYMIGEVAGWICRSCCLYLFFQFVTSILFLFLWVCFSLQCYYILWYEISGIISLLSYLLSLFSSYFMMLEVREFLKDTSVSILMIKTARKPPNYLPILIKFILCSM